MAKALTKKIFKYTAHSKDIKKGLLNGIIKQAESSEQEFLKLR